MSSSNKLKQELQRTIDAWDSLQEDKYDIRTIEMWLHDPMKSAIKRLRELLNE